MSAGIDHEALRQQLLLRAIWRDAPPAVVAGWLRDGAHLERGLQAYQAHAGALAERALAGCYPTVQQLLGGEAFAALARAFWQRQPPTRGDIAEWGGLLPAFVAADEQLAAEPYLADLARLEWAVHQAERAADSGAAPPGLALLADHDPAALWLRLQPGTAVVRSAHPIVTLWQAHRSSAADRFAPVRAAFAAGRAETASVRRCGWQAVVQVLDPGSAGFTAALLAGHSLALALLEADGAEGADTTAAATGSGAGSGFDFESWLLAALQSGLIAAVLQAPPGAPRGVTPSAGS